MRLPSDFVPEPYQFRILKDDILPASYLSLIERRFIVYLESPSLP